MPLWGKLDKSNNAPVFISQAFGQYPVNYVHTGSDVTFVGNTAAAARGYNNTDILVVNAASGTTYSNATFGITTAANGMITSFKKFLPGSFSANTTAAGLGFAITNSTYGTATGNSGVTGFTGTVNYKVTGDVLFGNNQTSVSVNNMVVGVYGVDQTEAGVAGKGVTPGWVVVKQGTGPVTGVAIGAGDTSAKFVNGETMTISNGSSNGVLTFTSNGFAGNSTSNVVVGNIATITITSGGAGFDTNTHVVKTFTRQLHVANLTVTGTGTGYLNTDTISVYGNATVAATTNATATITTNSTGGLTQNSTNIVITKLGLFQTTFTNTAATSTANVRIVVLAANGSNAVGTGLTITANIVPSTGGNVSITTLGGRAGRTNYETLAVVRSMSNAGADAEDTMFPDT